MVVDGCILRRPQTWQLCRRTEGGSVWIPLGLAKFSRNPGPEGHPWDRLPSLVRYWSHKGTQVVLFTRASNGRIVWLQFDVSVLFNELFTLIGLHWVSLVIPWKLKSHQNCWLFSKWSLQDAELNWGIPRSRLFWTALRRCQTGLTSLQGFCGI